MGMGEPFLNYDRVMAAAELLRCSYGGSIGPGRSRSALSGLIPRLTVSRTRNADTDWRSAWVPPRTRSVRCWSRLLAASQLRVMAAARRHSLARGERVMLAYVCIGGVNVDESDAVVARESDR